MRVLALDYGRARCGCAISDPTGVLATPLDPILQAGTRKGLQRVAAVVRDRGAERVLVGLPLSLAGADTDQTRETRDFAQRLQRVLGAVPVQLEDERLTTRLAARTGGRSSEDSRAAAHLLEGWLARQAHQGAEGG